MQSGSASISTWTGMSLSPFVSETACSTRFNTQLKWISSFFPSFFFEESIKPPGLWCVSEENVREGQRTKEKELNGGWCRV